jgi:hypothetical protein
VNILKRLLPILALCGIPAGAVTLTYSASGTFSGSTPTTTFSGPGKTWTLSFQVDSNPVVSGFSAGGGFSPVFSNFSYTLNGSPVSVTPTSFTFSNAAFGGGLGFCFIATPNPCTALSLQTGPQMYTGPESAPTMLTGGFTTGTFFAVGTSLFSQPNTTIQVAAPIPSTPIPSSLILTLIGLGCLGFYVASRKFARAS